jgi:AraC-like DNA-binding protein
MTFNSIQYLPHPLLQDHVRHYIHYTFTKRVQQPFLPVGRQTLAFSLGKAFRMINKDDQPQWSPRVAVIGQITSLRYSYFEEGSEYLIIKLKPCAFHDLFGFPMHELADEGIDFNEIAGATVQELTDKLSHTSGMQAAIALVEDFLIQRLPHSRQQVMDTQRIAMYLQEKKGDIRMDTLAKEMNRTQKSLERHFLEMIGVTPKLYARMLRMQHACQLAQQHHNIRVQEIIYACGYYDYAHLRRELLELTGMAPRALKQYLTHSL